MDCCSLKAKQIWVPAICHLALICELFAFQDSEEEREEDDVVNDPDYEATEEMEGESKESNQSDQELDLPNKVNNR